MNLKMKLMDIIKLSFTNAKRAKSSYLIMILVIIASASCLFSLSYKNSFDRYWNSYVKNSPEFRIMNVSYINWLDERDKRIMLGDASLDPDEKLKIIDETTKEVMDVLATNEHILGVSQQYRVMAQIDYFENHNFSFVILGVPLDNNIEIVSGNNLDSYSENDKVMICPNIVYYRDKNNIFYGNQKTDMNDLIGQAVTLSMADNATDEYKIVGLYDTISNYAYGEICYTSYANVKSLDDIYYEAYPHLYQEHLEYMKTIHYTGDNVFIMIDDVENLGQINDFLHENNLFQEGAIVGINTETVDEIMKSCSYITLGMLVLSGIIICLTLVQNITKRTKEFYLYNVLGYSKKDILKLIFIENSILIIIGYIFAIIAAQIGLIIYKNIVLIHKSRLYLMNPRVDMISILIGLLVALIIPILITVTISIFTRKRSFSSVEE